MASVACARNREKLIFLGFLEPESESEQWVTAIAKKTGFDYSVAKKVRQGDIQQVTITLPEYDFNNKTVAIIDDMASTDSISHPTACIHLDRLLAQAIKKFYSLVILFLQSMAEYVSFFALLVIDVCVVTAYN